MGTTVRNVLMKFPGRETIEGAGVRLRRSFSNGEVRLLDPFLLLDSFGSDNPADYRAGFPWHPHRGIETITYMLEGSVEHGDTLGNRGTIGSGDLQWMRSGGGIIHQEMPQVKEGELRGFQLWLNMPARSKRDPPSYQDVRSSRIPLSRGNEGQEVRVVAGTYDGVEGPIHTPITGPEYLDINLPEGVTLSHPVPGKRTVFVHGISGTASFGEDAMQLQRGETLLFGDGGAVSARAGPGGARFLLVSGVPLREPIAWYGPIVMNSESEIATAIQDLRRGTFLQHREALIKD